MRALNRTYNPKERWPFDATLDALRHKPWERPAPDGYSDESAYWMGADAMRIRLETAQMNAWSLQRLGPVGSTAGGLGASLYGPILSETSALAIRRAPNQQQGLTTLFMTPEFQRR